MGSVTANYNEDANFWETNPQFKILGDFAVFYSKDRTRGKQYSSKIMWALAFFIDTDKDNKFRNFPEAERMTLIEEEFINDKRFTWEEAQYLIDLYEETQLTQQKRSLIFLKRKMEERETFLSKTTYTLDNAKELDLIMANTEKLSNLVSKLEEQIKKEDEAEGGQVRGGRVESASELKQI